MLHAALITSAGIAWIGCSDTIVDPRRPSEDAGPSDTPESDISWDFDVPNLCSSNERLCEIPDSGTPCEPLDDAGLPPIGCGPQTQCVDVMSDNQRCGSCETSCNTQRFQCTDGQCKCKIEDADSCGSDTCIDLNTTDWHCGECYHVCGSGKNCVGGTCLDAPGDRPYSIIANDPLAPIELSAGLHTTSIYINNYGKDEPLAPATGDACSDANGPDVFFRVLIPPPPNPSANYGSQFSISVNKPGYAVAIWTQDPANAAPNACDTDELGNATLTFTNCSTRGEFAIMVRKLYATTEANSPVTVTISSSGGNICYISP